MSCWNKTVIYTSAISSTMRSIDMFIMKPYVETSV